MKTTIAFCVLAKLCLAQGSYPTGKWSYELPAPVFGSAAAADLDADGNLELVFTTYTNDGKAHCLHAEDGTVAWVFDMGGCGDVAPLIYDVDGDGALEVLLQGSCVPTLFCVDGATGQQEWAVHSGGGDSPPVAVDTDGNGTVEILLGNFQGKVLVLNGIDGTPLATLQADPLLGPIQTAPSPVDVNADGRLDVIVGNYFNNDLFIWAYDWQSGQKLWTVQQSDSSSFNAYHAGAVADVDGDGNKEYLIGTNNGYVRALHVEDGAELWSIHIPESTMGAVSVADLDGNGSLELVVFNNDWVQLDERVWVLDAATGQTLWSFATTFSSFRGCAIADINGNDTLDLVFSTFMGRVLAVEPFEGLIWEISLADSLPSNLPYVLTDNAPICADFDGNGAMDVFVAAGYGTYTPDSQNVGKAFMMEAGIGQCPEWTMFRQDAQRSGFLSPQEISEACGTQSVNKHLSAQEAFPYPNPCHDFFSMTGSEDACYRLVDLTGTEIKHWCGRSAVDTKGLAPSLYLVVPEKTGSGRLLSVVGGP